MLAGDLARSLDPTLLAADIGIDLDLWQRAFLYSPSKRSILCCSRQSGKSTVTAVRALHTAMYNSGALVVLAAPSQAQSAELLRTIRMMHSKLEGAPTLANESVLKIEFPNGSRIKALAASESGRGLAGAALVIFDEASRCDDDLFVSLRATVATSNGSLILLSTPAGRRGKFFELWTNGDPAWERISVAASQCPRISPDFLAAELKELGQARFSEEFELAFIDQNTAAFDSSIIDAAFSTELRALWT
jgi:hypothetical protein